jgi:colicin import membrane protein
VREEPKTPPAPSKADIELKKKEEKLKLEQEKKKQEELQRKEQEKQDKLKQEQARRAQEDAQRLQREAQEAAARQQAAAQQAASSRLVSDYKGRIQARIKRFIVLPADISGNPQAEFEVVLMPTGEVLHARLVRPSGNNAYDTAVERAILKAQPLPLPPDPALFPTFRELQLKFRPNE